MASSESIARDQWVEETRTLSASEEAFKAYVELERFVVDHTDLIGTYRRNTKGESHYATFNGSAQGKCSIIQMFNGRCELIWKWRKAIPGMSSEQHREINEAMDRFRESLDGSPEKSWEQVKVLTLGVPRVQESLRSVAAEVLEVMERDS